MITLLINYFILKDFDPDTMIILSIFTLCFDFLVCWGIYNIIIKLIDKL